MANSMIFALVLFAITYILIFALQRYRPYVALASAIVFVIVGSLGIFPDFKYDIFDAFSQIDWNVLMMIAGTMGTVSLFIESKMPQRLSDIIISKVKSIKIMVLVLSLFAGIISAFVDNVATVLMVAPVALAICCKMEISPVPTIICIAISSNLQGAATLVGDTTSILLAKAAGLDFTEFFFVEGKIGMFFVTEIGAVVSAFIILFLFRNEDIPIKVNEKTNVDDIVPTWLLILTILSLIAASFIPYKEAALEGQFYKPEISNGIICLFYFVIGEIRQCIKDRNTVTARKAIREIDYYTIILLAALFVVIGGIQKAGIIDLIANTIARLSGDGSRMSVFIVYSVIVWMSVLLSAFIDNIPYTATMLPVVASLSEKLSTGAIYVHPNLLFFGLLVGATLGGNLTPVGASANIAGIGILRKEGFDVSSKSFMKYGVPFTLAAVITAYVLLWLIWM